MKTKHDAALTGIGCCVAVVRLCAGRADSITRRHVLHRRMDIPSGHRRRVSVLRFLGARHYCTHRLVACHLGVAAFPSQSLLRGTTISALILRADLL